MENPPLLVLDNILSHLSFAKLLQIRVVNQRFRDIATRIIKPKLRRRAFLRTTSHLTKFISTHNNSLCPFPFEEFILNPNIGTDSEFLEFCEIYAYPVTHLYINVSPDDPSFYLWFYFRDTCSAVYDTKVFERITQFLLFAHNIQVLILEQARHSSDDINTHVDRIRSPGFPEAPEIPLFPKLISFHAGSRYLRELQWTQELIKNAPGIEQPSTESDEKALTEHMRRNLLWVAADGMHMELDFKCTGFRRLSDADVKDAEHIEIFPSKMITRGLVFNRIIDSPNLNSYVFPRVVTIELFLFGDNDESAIFLQPSTFPALRCVYTDPLPVCGSINPFNNNVYETVDEFHFKCGYDDEDEIYKEPFRWDEIFPNVRKLVATANEFIPFEQHLSYLLPRFRKIETLGVTIRCTDPNWKVITGGNPDFVSFKKLAKLEFKYMIFPELLEELVTSSSLGYLSNVTSISISADSYISNTIGKEKTLSYLENLNLKHDYVELIERINSSRDSTVQFYPR